MYLILYTTLPHLILKITYSRVKVDIIISFLEIRKLRQNNKGDFS